MAARAQQAGARYFSGFQVRKFEIKRDNVSITVSGNGRVQAFESRCLVSACGFNPFKFDSIALPVTDYTMGAQAVVETSGDTGVEVYLGRKYAPGFFAWLVPTADGLGLAGLMSRRNAAAYLGSFITDLTHLGKIKRAHQPTYRPIPLHPPRQTHSRRFIAVGSAAGQVKPLTGGGIYYGLLCADIAARNLSRALLENDLSSENLSSYSRDWRRRLGREINTSYMARKLFELLSDRQVDRIFDVARRERIPEAYSETGNSNI